ncbi:hypothetical protein OAF37_01320 [Rubripirellula sp.]|nr:hypothetical protein [Rubripirellula sp.]MDB4644674.1 hypothetical protein [Rubripirellula sp.]
MHTLAGTGARSFAASNTTAERGLIPLPYWLAGMKYATSWKLETSFLGLAVDHPNNVRQSLRKYQPT